MIDIRFGLLIVAGFGVVINLIMLVRLQRDVLNSRSYALLDTDRLEAVRSRRRQSIGLLIVLVAIALSALFDAGSNEARLMVLVAAIAADWKSYRLYVDRINADAMVIDLLRRKRDVTLHKETNKEE